MTDDSSGVAVTPKNDMMGDVARFHQKFRLSYDGKPRVLPRDLFDYRHKFHIEEITEYSDEQPILELCLNDKDTHFLDDDRLIQGLETQLDSLVDAAWVILGTAELQFGARRFNEAWRRVAVANMAKVLATDDPTAQDSGREIKYDVRKPPGWTAPCHRDLVENHAHLKGE